MIQEIMSLAIRNTVCATAFSLAVAGAASSVYAEPAKSAGPAESSVSASTTAPESVSNSGFLRWLISLNCSNGTCSGQVDLATNYQFAVVRYLNCYARVKNGVLYEMWSNGQDYLIDLGLQWQRKVGKVKRYNLAAQTQLFLAPGSAYKVFARYTGNMQEAYCTVSSEFAN